MRQHVITSMGIVLGLAVAAGARAQITITDQIGGIPSVAGAYLETFDEPRPTILTLSGNAFLVTGTPAFGYTAPYYSGSTSAYFGELPDVGSDTTQYVAVQSGGTATLHFSSPENYLGLLWGSIDTGFNYIDLYDGSSLIGSVQASQLTGIQDNSPGIDGTAYVNVNSTTPFSSAVFNTTGPQGDFSFEFDDVAYAMVVPEPSSAFLVVAGLCAMVFVMRRKRQAINTN